MVTLTQYRRHAIASAVRAAVRLLDDSGFLRFLGNTPDALAARNAIETLRTLALKYLAL